MKKYFIAIIFTFSFLVLLATSQNSCQFLYINPSLVSSSFGIDSGVADFKHLSATSGMNNPALLGKLKGASIDYSECDYVFGKFASSQLSFHYKDFTVSLPSFNNIQKFGTSLEYRNIYGSFTPVESVQKFQVGANIDKYLASYLPNLPDVKLYSGISVNHINSEISSSGFGETETNDDLDGKAFTFDLGFAGEYKTKDLVNSDHDLTFYGGLNIVNLIQSTITYVNGDNSLPSGVKIGVAGDYIINLNREQFYIPLLTDILFQLAPQQNQSLDFWVSNDFNFFDDRQTVNFGAEISYSALLFARFGYTNNFETELDGKSYGFGAKIPIQKINVTVDYIKMFDESEIYYPERWSFGLQYLF